MTLTAPSRITSIDALRGLTVAFMILVNDPGDWAHVYWPLDHAEWNGFTPTDMVFPMFLFLVGCAIVFSVDSRLKKGVPRRTIALQIVRRAAIIFALKMFLSAYPHFHLTRLRLYGVLTRIALCYLATGLLFLYVRSVRALAGIAVALLVGYWILLRFVPIPGLGLPVRDFPILDPDRNLTAWLDRGVSAFTQQWLHTGRLYEKTRDPEGLLSTLPAIATTLFGVLAALWLRGKETAAGRREGLLACAGLLSLALGVLWNPWFPINKKLWTSSYVLFAGGWSLLGLAAAFWLFDARRVQLRSRAARAVLWPLQVFGANALAAYIFSEFLVETLLWIKLPPDAAGHTLTAWAWSYLHLFARHGSTANTSVAFAAAYVALCFVPNWLLWRKKIFVRV
jgi:predicted acyltransferase